MIAYNTLWLRHLFTREQALNAFHQDCIDQEELNGINSKFAVNFYSPNFFIRIGLFILTTVIVIFSFGLLALISLNSIDKAVGGMAIFFALLVYGALEYIVQTKRHFQSGVDDALLWISACFLFGGISFIADAGEISNCMIIFMISFYGSLRFADRVMSVVSYISLLGIFFFTCIRIGPTAKYLVPFVIMALSMIIYFSSKRISRFRINQLYTNCVHAITISALVSLYLAGNYFVVREFGDEMFNVNLSKNENIPLGWLFWCFTFLIPCLYIFRGVQKKDIVLIRVGLLLVAAIIFTVRYYYTVPPIEVIMLAGGMVLMLVSYVLSLYLITPKYGFVNQELVSEDAKKKLEIESILLAQTFARQTVTTDNTQFGGGSFGGGGTSGGF